MSFVLLTESSLDAQVIELLKKMNDSPGGVVLMFSDLKDNEKIKDVKHEQLLHGMIIVKLKGKNNGQIRNKIR